MFSHERMILTIGSPYEKREGSFRARLVVMGYLTEVKPKNDRHFLSDELKKDVNECNGRTSMTA